MADLKHLVAVGEAVIDYVATVDDSFLALNAVRKGAQIVLTEEDALRFENLVRHIKIPGGCAANVVDGFTRLGGNADFIGKLGPDNNAKLFLNAFDQSKVRSLCPPGKQPSGRIFTYITPDKERSFASYHGAGYELSVSDLPEEFPEEPILYLDGYTLHTPNGFEVFMEAIRKCKKCNGRVVFSPNNIFILESYPEHVKSLAELSDIIFLSEEELAVFTGREDFEESFKKLDHGKVYIITLGSRGCLVFDHGREIHIDSVKPEKGVVDLNGAGDAFAAGFLYGISIGLDYNAAGQLATHCATHIITKEGARVAHDIRSDIPESLFSREEE